MRQPEELSFAELVALVRDIRDLLYLDTDDKQKEVLNADKEWDADTLTLIAERLAADGLTPTTVADDSGDRPEIAPLS